MNLIGIDIMRDILGNNVIDIIILFKKITMVIKINKRFPLLIYQLHQLKIFLILFLKHKFSGKNFLKFSIEMIIFNYLSKYNIFNFIFQIKISEKTF